ncbi:MAG TPA: ParA family protein [Roseateles sp.]|nr:ParA family protein [Roseateles sp.]
MGLANQKSGVGKSAAATLLTHCCAGRGRRVLVLDLDHQGNASRPLCLSGWPTVAAFTADAVLAGAAGALPDAAFVLVPGDRALIGLERQPELHTPFARNYRAFALRAAAQLDVCIVDTNPSPDIRLISALASADWLLAPVQLNQEVMDGIHGTLNHDRVGMRKIRAVLNPRLQLMGLLPSMTEPTPFQRADFAQVIERCHQLLIHLGTGPGQFAFIPLRTAIAEAQASGEVLWEMKKTAARDAWREIERGIACIAARLEGQEADHGAAA